MLERYLQRLHSNIVQLHLTPQLHINKAEKRRMYTNVLVRYSGAMHFTRGYPSFSLQIYWNQMQTYFIGLVILQYLLYGFKPFSRSTTVCTSGPPVRVQSHWNLNCVLKCPTLSASILILVAFSPENIWISRFIIGFPVLCSNQFDRAFLQSLIIMFQSYSIPDIVR